MEMTEIQEGDANAPNEKVEQISKEPSSSMLASSIVALNFGWHHPKHLNLPMFKKTVNGWHAITIELNRSISAVSALSYIR